MTIKGGNSNKPMDVNNDSEGLVKATTQTGIKKAALKGNAFSWLSTDSDIDVGDTRLFIRNDSTTPLYLDRAIFLPANVACDWSINIGNANTTPTGTAVVAANLTQAGRGPDATSYDDETAVADGTEIDYVHTDTTGTITHSLDGVILMRGQYIQINQEIESTSGRVIVYGYYDSE